MDILFEWALVKGPHLKFLFKDVDPANFYQIPKYTGTKIDNQRPMYITMSDDKGVDPIAFRDVWKTMSHTCHYRGNLSENQQWIDKAKTEALLGVIPSGDKDMYKLWFIKMRLEHDANYRT